MLANKDNSLQTDLITNSRPFQTPKNQARGNRKTLKRHKTMSKINFRNLKLKSHKEYLISRTYFVC